MTSFEKDISALRASIGRAILGKENVIEEILICLLARGHLLIEDVPGVGKTTLALALARSIDGKFQRVQFTSDLLPSDVLGVTIFNSDSREFEFKPGPIFTNILLADEINRTTPKTQSALLEAMQDGAVTVERITHPLPQPFMVVATQNPIEFHGTYPLPESQLDRFLMRIPMGYPSPEAEQRILETKGRRETAHEITPVCSGQRIAEMQHAVTEVRVDPSLSKYMLELVNRTRKASDLELGVSPRGAISLFKASQARAFIQGRDYATPDDIKQLIVPTLAHRLILSGRRSAALGVRDGDSMAQTVLAEIASTVEVPV
ncbi:MAG: MoxR family ATPase [Pseudomonadota bacterium]